VRGLRKIDFEVHYLTRVEGHANIVLSASDRTIKELRLEITEAPRFFEAFMRGTNYKDVAYVVSRVCGICSIGHSNASVKATEAAFGVEVSEQTKLLRKLMMHGENMQSHALHVYFLAFPDFLGAPSVFPLMDSNPEVVKIALKVKRLANDLSDMFAGRTTHPIRNVPGGVTMVPSKDEMYDMKRRLYDAMPDIETTARLLSKVKIPEFERKTEFIALRKEDEYAIYDGRITSSTGKSVDDSDYKALIKEFVVPHSTAKHARASMDSYMVGALARCNLSFGNLSPFARRIADICKFTVPNFNPFMNTVAQLVEIAHSLEDSINIIDCLLDQGVEEPIRVEFDVKAGRGVGVVEVPRGILFHEYEYDAEGRLVYVNLVIPTAQNLENIELDMKELVPKIMDRSEEEIQHLLEMLVRAYDPCISCSAHMVDVKIV